MEISLFSFRTWVECVNHPEAELQAKQLTLTWMQNTLRQYDDLVEQYIDNPKN